ncbi:MAG: 1-acyl-sn-glycerol-3-phosphate acyltransferase [Desulfobacterales bacterium]|nr:1-acyl-sn-glycerol-3-phosphate acyltransferase [Desulfobacterales bacterium]MBF0395548.1 1-acyl-sn-glycerol-3-phosphate acyltransferase [Desulfobacterales bacterium]
MLKSILMNVTVFPMMMFEIFIGIFFSPMIFLVIKIITYWENDKIVRLMIWLYGRGWLIIVSPFVKFKREGFKRNPIKKPSIIVVNHLSFFDTYFMSLLPISNVVFTIRSWPFKMFWYKPFMQLAKYIDVEKIGWDKTFEYGKELLSKGSSLLFFPEGHRSRNGKLQRFHSGAFKLSVATGFEVVPLCIKGTDQLLPPGKLFLYPAKVYLKRLPSVSPNTFKGETAHIEMRKSIKEMMEKTFSK